MSNKLCILSKFVRFTATIFAIIFLITFIFPTKFCLKSYPQGSDKQFYIVRYDCMKNWWILAGDSKGLYDWNEALDIPIDIKGKDIQEIMSGDLYLRNLPTYFVLWGEVEIQKQYDEDNNLIYQQHVINCTDWDILDRIHSRNQFRMKFSNKYLTIYDYKWFDDFRKLFWVYEEY